MEYDKSPCKGSASSSSDSSPASDLALARCHRSPLGLCLPGVPELLWLGNETIRWRFLEGVSRNSSDPILLLLGLLVVGYVHAAGLGLLVLQAIRT